MSPSEARAPFGGDRGAEGSGGLGRRPRRPADWVRRARALAVLLLLVVSALLIRTVWRGRPPAPPPMLVELQGALGDPGVYELAPGTTVREALLEAGAPPEGILDPFADLALEHGYRVVLLPDGSTRIWLADERLLVGLPLDPNTADLQLLEQLPGVGPARARAIVEERVSGGPFERVDDLVRVRGIGPATLEELRPFLSIDGIGEPGSGSEDAPWEAGP
jgi:competence protein ComEA